MEYFLLKLSPKVKNPVRLRAYYADTDSPIVTYESLKELSVAYIEDKGEVELTDILASPIFMVSGQVKQLLQLFEPDIKFKAIQMFGFYHKEELKPLYYVPKFPEYPCLHKEVTVNPNGTVNKVVLDKSKIPEASIFRIQGLIENRIIISLEAAESLLRRPFYGIGLEKVEVKE